MKKIIILCLCMYTSYIQAKELSVVELIKLSYIKTGKNKLTPFKANNFEINFQKDKPWINKENKEDAHNHLLLNYQSLTARFVTKHEKQILFRQEEFRPYGQGVFVLTCKEPNNQTLLFIQTHYSNSSNIDPWYIYFKSYAYHITKNGTVELDKQIIDKYFYGEDYAKRRISDTEPPIVSYPYYNKVKALQRLYETNICIKPFVTLSFIENNLKQKKQLKTYSKEFFQNLLTEKPIENKTLTTYNNIAYYLQKANANKEAIFLLEKILKKYPNRTVAHYNLADAYWELGEKKKAVASYKNYIKQMKEEGKEKRIPKVVKERASFK